MRVRFDPGNDNTAASTVNVAGLGVKSIRSLSGNVIAAGEISAGEILTLEFDLSNDRFALVPQSASLIAGRKNILFGNFRVNQRAVSGSVVLAAGVYGHDRFRAGSGGCTYTFATSAGITTITISAGTLEQEVEGVNIDTGGHVLSWSGTAQGQINSGGFGASGVPTANLVAGTNATVEFDTGTLALPQLERGSFPTRFEWRPITEEEMLCRRYFERITYAASTYVSVMHAVSTTVARGELDYLPKRAVPAFSDSGIFQAIQASGTVAGGTLGIAEASVSHARVAITGATGLVAGNASALIANVAGSIDIDAEL